MPTMAPLARGSSGLVPGPAALRRGQFLAGLLCLGFLAWLACAGLAWLFRPAIEDWLDRPYENLPLHGPRATPSAEAGAALAAVPGAAFGHYQPPATATGAAQVLVVRQGVVYRVYVEPGTLRAMQVVEEDRRPVNRLARLHDWLLPAPGAAVAAEAGRLPGPAFADLCTSDPAVHLRPLDQLVPLAAGLHLPRPVWISPPVLAGGEWAVDSQAQDRELRVVYTVDAERAAVTAIRRFGDPDARPPG